MSQQSRNDALKKALLTIELNEGKKMDGIAQDLGVSRQTINYTLRTITTRDKLMAYLYKYGGIHHHDIFPELYGPPKKLAEEAESEN